MEAFPIIHDDTVRTRARTMKLGLTWHESDPNIDGGFVLYSSIYPEDRNHNYVRIINMDGEEVHRWDLGPKRPGMWAYMPEPECVKRYCGDKDPRGYLLALSQMPMDEISQSHDLISWESDRGGYMQLIDFEGNIVWTYKDEYQHHDGRLTKTGMLVYLANEPISSKTKTKEVVDRAAERRGFPQIPQQKLPKMYGDVIKMVDPLTEQILFEWRAEDHFDPEIDKLNYNDPFDEWGHGNTIVPLYENPENPQETTHLLVSFRQISTIMKINIKTNEFERLLRRPFISQQHDCTILEEGNTDRILVFDNRYIPNDFAPSAFSAVMEWNLKEQSKYPFLPMLNGPKVEWLYMDGVCDFYSAYISGAQRIPGWEFKRDKVQYTLITEGMKGRIFMVKTTPFITPDDKRIMKNHVIWEYVNPEIAPGEGRTVLLGRSSIFRARYYSPTHFTHQQLQKMRHAPHLVAKL